MEFGSKDWFEKVNELFQFPVIMAFYLSNKHKSINSTVIQSNAKNIGEIKFTKVAPFSILNNG